jgi:hypothetical protein
MLPSQELLTVLWCNINVERDQRVAAIQQTTGQNRLVDGDTLCVQPWCTVTVLKNHVHTPTSATHYFIMLLCDMHNSVRRMVALVLKYNQLNVTAVRHFLFQNSLI